MSSAEPKLIFVIEDDDEVRGSTRLLLEAMGFAVREFASAEAFLKVTDGREADCLVLDFHLSGMSGIDLLEMLRSKGVDTPAIVVSANGNRLARRAARLGVVAILHKPLAADGLAQWLAEILQ